MWRSPGVGGQCLETLARVARGTGWGLQLSSALSTMLGAGRGLLWSGQEPEGPTVCGLCQEWKCGGDTGDLALGLGQRWEEKVGRLMGGGHQAQAGPYVMASVFCCLRGYICLVFSTCREAPETHGDLEAQRRETPQFWPQTPPGSAGRPWALTLAFSRVSHSPGGGRMKALWAQLPTDG